MIVLDQIICIYYLIQFQKDKGKDVLLLINSGNKMNIMTLTHAFKLGLKMRKINISAQKIDGSLLKTYGMVIVAFYVFNKSGKFLFF